MCLFSCQTLSKCFLLSRIERLSEVRLTVFVHVYKRHGGCDTLDKLGYTFLHSFFWRDNPLAGTTQHILTSHLPSLELG